MGRLLAALAMICLAAGAVSGQGILVEAETFISYHNEGGDIPIVVSCSAASNGLAVEGFDYPGDWIEVSLTVWNGSFTDSITSAGLLDSASTIRATIFGAGPGGSQLTSSFSTYGAGIG